MNDPRLAQAVQDARSLDLGLLAKRINDEAGLHVQDGRRALEHARRCGLLLLEAKRLVGFGRFGSWVSANCRFKRRMASYYMQIARRYGDDSHFGIVATLSQAAALRLATECPVPKRKASSEQSTPEAELEAFRKQVTARLGLSEARRKPWPMGWLLSCLRHFDARGPHAALTPEKFCAQLPAADLALLIECAPRLAEWLVVLATAAREESAIRPRTSAETLLLGGER